MNYNLQLLPDSAISPRMLNDNINGGVSKGKLLSSPDKITLDCETLESPYTFPFCSILLPLSDNNNGLNLEKYDSLTVELEFKSNNRDTVLIYLLNKEWLISSGKELNRANMKVIYPLEQVSTYTLALTDFHLPSWWLFNHADDTHELTTRINNVVAIQISTGDNRTPRSENITVYNLTLKGKWLSQQQLYSFILASWLMFLTVHGVMRFRKLALSYKNSKRQANSLIKMNKFLKIEKSKFEHLAKIDPLTQIYNRAGIRNELSQAISDYQYTKQTSVLIIFDIDYFKVINDSWGHDIGDQVLKKIAYSVRANIRAKDSLARWGGEEFILLCRQTGLPEALAIAEKLRLLIANTNFNPNLKVTCSFGLAELKTDDVSHWFKVADENLYQAKKAGRNCIRY
jgi:diguanylate cyclase (GGDEF)-like protein